MGNLGASEEVKDLSIKYGVKVMEEEEEPLEFLEEQRKRRQEGRMADGMEGVVFTSEKPRATGWDCFGGKKEKHYERDRDEHEESSGDRQGLDHGEESQADDEVRSPVADVDDSSIEALVSERLDLRVKDLGSGAHSWGEGDYVVVDDYDGEDFYVAWAALGYRWCLGNEKKIQIWTEPWLREDGDCHVETEVEKGLDHWKVSDLVGLNGDGWDEPWLHEDGDCYVETEVEEELDHWKVSDLVGLNGDGWDEDLVCAIFSDRDTEAILRLRLQGEGVG
ncbi:hypothetical protein LINPERHAP1_LOCUS21802 [Linum perenne]